MIVSASVVMRPRSRRCCDECRKPIQGPTLRLYGAAHSADSKYVLWLHPSCTSAEWAMREPKVARALATLPNPSPKEPPR